MVWLVKRFVAYLRWLYLQYLLNTALYMLEPSEIKVFNSMLIGIAVTSVYSAYRFLPAQILRIYTWVQANDTLDASILT